MRTRTKEKNIDPDYKAEAVMPDYDNKASSSLSVSASETDINLGNQFYKAGMSARAGTGGSQSRVRVAATAERAVFRGGLSQMGRRAVSDLHSELKRTNSGMSRETNVLTGNIPTSNPTTATATATAATAHFGDTFVDEGARGTQEAWSVRRKERLAEPKFDMNAEFKDTGVRSRGSNVKNEIENNDGYDHGYDNERGFNDEGSYLGMRGTPSHSRRNGMSPSRSRGRSRTGSARGDSASLLLTQHYLSTISVLAHYYPSINSELTQD